MTINYRDTAIFFTAKGTGNPIVLLHGFLESSSIWASFVEALSEKRQVICVDLPGHGKSGTIGDVHSMELMADVVKTVLNYLGVSTASFAGHSMGGYVALAFLEKYPENIQAIGLINSTPEKDSPERIENRNRAIELIKKNKRAFVSMAISNLLTPENNKKFKEEVDKLKEEALKFPTEGITACIEGMKIRTDKKELLKKCKGQKIWLTGKNDSLLFYKSATRIAKYCNCELITTNGGHLAYIENPVELREILHFID